jgi:hypothetical protein
MDGHDDGDHPLSLQLWRESIVFLALGAGFFIPIGLSGNLFAAFRGD